MIYFSLGMKNLRITEDKHKLSGKDYSEFF